MRDIIVPIIHPTTFSDVEMGKPTEIKAQEGQVIKAVENVLPLKLVVPKDQKGHKPPVNRQGL